MLRLAPLLLLVLGCATTPNDNVYPTKPSSSASAAAPKQSKYVRFKNAVCACPNQYCARRAQIKHNQLWQELIDQQAQATFSKTTPSDTLDPFMDSKAALQGANSCIDRLLPRSAVAFVNWANQACACTTNDCYMQQEKQLRKLVENITGNTIDGIRLDLEAAQEAVARGMMCLANSSPKHSP